MAKYRVAVIPGDGIGPEVMSAAVSVLTEMQDRSGKFSFEFKEYMAGDAYKAKTGCAMTEETFEAVKASDVCLFSAVGATAKEVITPTQAETQPLREHTPRQGLPERPQRQGADGHGPGPREHGGPLQGDTGRWTRLGRRT